MMILALVGVFWRRDSLSNPDYGRDDLNNLTYRLNFTKISKEINFETSDNIHYTYYLHPGRYNVVCKGAQGAVSNLFRDGGKGSYVSANFTIREQKRVNVIVGKKGVNYKSGTDSRGLPDGGASTKGKIDTSYSGGGGASSRIIIDDNNVIVAAEGSGASGNAFGAPGGGENYVYMCTSMYCKDLKKTADFSDNCDSYIEVADTYYPPSGAGGGYKCGVQMNGCPSGGDCSYLNVATSGSSHCIEGGIVTNCDIKDGSTNFGNVNDGDVIIKELLPENCASINNINNLCAQCKPGYYNEDGFCVTQCSPNYFQAGSICNRCSDNCLTCQDSADKCTSCKEGEVLQNNKCQASCDAGFFSENGICKECNENCYECIDRSDKCLSCRYGKVLQGNECKDSCDSGFFNEDGICKVCSSDCATCSESSDKCTSCKEGEVLQNDKCQTSCNFGFYNEKGICKECNKNCYECIDRSDKCTSCKEGKVLQGNQCRASCDEGYYNLSDLCQECSSSCNTCSLSYDNCTSCHANQVLQGNRCEESCDEKFFASNGICNRCDQTCMTCSMKADNCTSCQDDLILVNGSCIKCGIHCSECISPTKCTKCTKGYSLFNDHCNYRISPKLFPYKSNRRWK